MNRDGERWEPEPGPQKEFLAADDPRDPREDLEPGPTVQAYHQMDEDEFFSAILASEVFLGSTREPRRHVGAKTLQVDVQLQGGERFRILVQRLH